MSTKRFSEDFDLDSMGTMPTMKRQVMSNGMITSASDEHSIWLYAKVPLLPVADARDTDRLISAYMPLYEALDQIAGLTPRSAIKRRSASKNSYRRVHILRTNVPKLWQADVVAPREMRHGQQNLNRYLNSVMHGEITRDSVLLLGVELAGSMIAGGLKHLAESFTYTLVEGGTPLSDYDYDLERLNRIFARAGLSQPTPGDIAAADSWWNPGSNPDIPTLAHPEHMHIIRDAKTVRAIDRLEKDGIDCEEWPDDLTRGMGTRAGQSMVSFGSVADIELEFDRADDPKANWLVPLLDSGALAVSIRGSLEPQQMTRAEIRRNRRNYLNDRAEQQQHGRMSRGEQEEKVSRLQQVEDVYAGGHGSPTLVEASTLVAMDGKVRDFGAIKTAAIIQPMEHRQDKSWVEMMIASTLRANSNIHDMPIQNIAASGIQDASKSGDRHGILRGFAERDGTPTYTNPQEAYNEEDAPPVSIVCSSSGGGKSVALSEIIKTPSGDVQMGDLKVGDIVYGRDGRPCNVVAIYDQALETTDAYKLRLSDGQVFTVDSNHQFVVSDFRARNYHSSKHDQHGVARRQRLMGQVEQLREIAVEYTDDQLVGAEALVHQVAPIVDENIYMNKASVHAALRMVDVASVGAHHLYPHRKALLGLSIRLEQVAQNALLRTSDDDEQVLSVGEMMGRGLKASNAGSQFAIKLSQPVQGIHRDLPMDPYVFGIWLAYGATSGSSRLSNPDIEILDRIEAAGYTIKRGTLDKTTNPENWYEHDVLDWAEDLKATGAVGEKHIPNTYATASIEQRFDVLRGLMDSDGGISADGGCELSLSDQRLAEDALDLIRSLGIKASMNVNTAGYRDTDGDYVQTKDSHRIKFTTDKPVFWLQRKAERLRKSVRQTSQWLYIESIEPVEPEPMRCITVNSEDSTYLMGGYVPTHNTMMMQWEAFQADKLRYPQVLIDPKRDSDLTPTVEAMDNGRVFGLDRLAEENGIFDPMKYASTIEVGIEMAISNLAELNPYGSTIEMAQAEPLLQYALRYGAEKGHTSTMTALRRAVADGVIESTMVERIEMLSQSSPLFQALVGSDDDTVGLRVHDGTTLIMAGQQELDLPAPGKPPKSINQRITTALIRNIVQGSSMALTGRNGIIRLDEAWVFLSSNPEELVKLGRLARSQGTDVNLYTQRVTDITNANLQDHVTRGAIMYLNSVDEAKAACQLFGLEPTPERLGRITAKGTLDDDDGSPNYNSLRALRDPKTGAVVRGSVAIDIDIHGRAVPVEIRIPQSFLRLASTRAADVAQRKQMQGVTA